MRAILGWACPGLVYALCACAWDADWQRGSTILVVRSFLTWRWDRIVAEWCTLRAKRKSPRRQGATASAAGLRRGVGARAFRVPTRMASVFQNEARLQRRASCSRIAVW